MKLKLMLCALAASLLSGAVYAQMGSDEGGDDAGDTVAEQVQEALDTYDANKDGKVTRAEIKAYADKDAEGGTDMEKLETFGDLLIEFLAVDGDGDEIVTKKELTDYFTLKSNGKKPKLTAKDWKTIEKDYLDPDLALSMKQNDKDGDNKFNKDEAKAVGIEPEAFTNLDSDKDGKLSSEELKSAYKTLLKQTYEIEPGAAPVPEPEKKPDVDPALMKKAKEAFAKADTDGDGKITKAEFKKGSEKEPNKATWWGKYIAFLAIDTNDDMNVDFDEFLQAGLDSRAGKKGKIYPKDKKEACNEIWIDLDGDEDGKVTAAEYKKLFPQSDEFNQADSDGDGNLTKDEFWKFLKPNLESDFEFIEKDKTTEAKPAEGKDEPGKDESNGAADDDTYNLYKKKGRTWTYKMENGGMVILTKYEVLEVADDHAKVRISTLDKDGKPFMGTKPMEQEIKFAKTSGAGKEAPAMRKVEKTIKVAAGEFECVGYAIGDAEPTAWVSKKYPMLLIKTKAMELYEFKDAKDDKKDNEGGTDK